MVLPRPTLRNAPIRYKLLMVYSLAFAVALAVDALTTYPLVRRAVERDIESELTNSTSAILNLVKTSASSSIRSYLRGAADRNLELAEQMYERFRRGEISEPEARRRAAAAMLSQRIGKTGYICCLDSRGVMLIHPSPAIVSKNLSEFAFVRELSARKQGWFEYEWRNPGDEAPRPKAAFMRYFAPWDWIILASAYKDEFTELVNIDDFRESVLALKFGKTGYSYIVDTAGNVLLHPSAEGANIYRDRIASSDFLDDMRDKKSGKAVYWWRNPKDPAPRRKLVIYNRLPEYGWIVASASYLDEVYAPLRNIRNLFLGASAGSLLLVLLFTWWISSSITRPLTGLTQKLARAGAGDFSMRMEETSGDEVGRLARYFNSFMERLEEYGRSLETEIGERKQAEREWRRLELEVIEAGDRERSRIGQELHDDLTPHLIGIEVLSKVLAGRIGSERPDEAGYAQKIRSLTADAIIKSRALARGFFPLHLTENGLDVALRDLAANQEAIHGISCRFEGDEDPLVGHGAAATQLFYIAREAVHNAVKHSGASAIRIKLRRREGSVELRVEDNGRGMPQALGTEGIGLRIMRYRARLLGASLGFETGPEGGVVVLVSLPVSPGMEES